MAGEEKKPKAPLVKAFACPSCGSAVKIRAAGFSITAVCSSCGAVVDTTNENYKILSKAKVKERNLLIPLGTRGKLKGNLWEVIGYVERQEIPGTFEWTEYLLFNPFHGFRWLTEAKGHWNFVVTTKETPKNVTAGWRAAFKSNTFEQEVAYYNKTYQLFHHGRAKLTYVLGEFYWQPKVDDVVAVTDFVCPPEILSRETTGEESIWSIGEYIDANDIKTAFSIKDAMPVQYDVAPNQISAMSRHTPEIIKYWGIFVGLLFAMQFMVVLTAKNRVVYSGQFSHTRMDLEKVKTTPQFELPAGLGNVEVQLIAPVSNNWLEIQADLVNDDNGGSEDFEQGVEHYSGFDSEGGWSEGSHISYRRLSAVPSGKYHLNIEAASGLPANEELKYDITVRRDVVTWANFFWAFALLSIFPIFVAWRKRSFELDRWSQSDFSPYTEHQEEE